jgi:methionyl-tRNA formyltransferase
VRIVFAGTPDFAAASLHALAGAGFELIAVYTQPDRPAGRGRLLSPSPVKQLAQQLGLPVYQPASLRDPTAITELAALRPELLVVAAYGLILPRAVLDIPPLGCLNVHGSLLPRWRGAAPIQRAILAGDAETGICIMRMETGLDTGPVLDRAAIPITPVDTGGSLHDKLASLGAERLCAVLALLARGQTVTETPQDHAAAVYAHKLDKSEAALDWRRPAEVLERQVRAFNPWPVAQAAVQGGWLRVHHATLEGITHGATPGQILEAGPQGLLLACGEGALRLREVQAPGRRPIAFSDLYNARREAFTPGLPLASVVL